MITIETKEIIISEELKRKVEMICRFTNTKPVMKNGSIRSLKGTNIAYVEPHQAISNVYNKENVLNKTWYDSTISKILSNELYKGDYLAGKKTKKSIYYENVVEHNE